jgi:hypothetical protein
MDHIEMFQTRDEPEAARFFRNALAELVEFNPAVKQVGAFQRVQPWLPFCPEGGFPEGVTYTPDDHLPGPTVSLHFTSPYFYKLLKFLS